MLDVYCEFTVETESNGPWNGAHYVYLKADNRSYILCQKIGRNNMEASFSGRNNETSHCPAGSVGDWTHPSSLF